jgi:hypothetical protein
MGESFPFKSDNLPQPIPFEPIPNNFPALFELNGNLLVAIWCGAFCPFQSAMMNVRESTVMQKPSFLEAEYILMDM